MSTQLGTHLNTHTVKWLLRREFWEHKGSMFWAPAIVATLLAVLIGGTVLYGMAAHGIPSHLVVNGHPLTRGAVVAAIPLEMKTMIASMATSMYLVSAAPLFLMLAVVVFFYCLGALYDERRDRSILFWKSLPVSDPTTVLSKVVTALLVAPAITIVIGTLGALAQLLLACLALAFNGVNMFGAVLTSANLYLSPLSLVALLPVYIVWALPTIGWLLLISSWAKTKPFLWAVGIPIIALIAVKWVSVAMENFADQPLNVMHYVSDIAARLLGGVVPGIWFAFDNGVPPSLHPSDTGIDLSSVVSESYHTLAGPDAWIGVAMAAVMLYGAIRVRRWRDEG
jgi:ABC-2 type transport system permease protein